MDKCKTCLSAMITAGSSLATRPSKIESIPKLCCNFSSKKLFWVRKIVVVHNDSTKTEKRVIAKRSYTKTKYYTTEHINQRQRKCNAKSLVDSPEYQSTKMSSTCLEQLLTVLWETHTSGCFHCICFDPKVWLYLLAGVCPLEERIVI